MELGSAEPVLEPGFPAPEPVLPSWHQKKPVGRARGHRRSLRVWRRTPYLSLSSCK